MGGRLNNEIVCHFLYVLWLPQIFFKRSFYCCKNSASSIYTTRKTMSSPNRDEALIQICRKQFVPYSYTVKEFYDYWLWYYMWNEKDISYNTYMTYRNIILNYIDPALGTISLPSLKRKDLLQVLLRIPSPTVRKHACAIVSSSMQVARDKNYISCNIAMKITAEVNRLKRAEEQQLMDTYSARKRTVKVYSAAQLNCLQNICRQEKPSLYLPMLLATATGLRISELRALKYENIDFLNKYASIETQLGRTKISFCLFFLNKYYGRRKRTTIKKNLRNQGEKNQNNNNLN